MSVADKRHNSLKPVAESSIRVSVSFPLDLYETLEFIAKEKKVSMAWVVRDAAERYVAKKKLSLENTSKHAGK
jgi:metal-responsive CopG/Arc/MetJ family transcriptional regulator